MLSVDESSCKFRVFRIALLLKSVHIIEVEQLYTIFKFKYKERLD